MTLFTGILLMVASLLLQAVFAPKQQGPEPAALADAQFPTADEGTPQCVIFGDCWSGDWTVLATGNYSVQEIHSSSGKK